MKNQKTIIVCAPKDFELHHLIEKNLIYHGFDVTIIFPVNIKFKYKSIWQKIYNAYRKTIFKDKNHKIKLLELQRLEYLKKNISKKEKYDYGLFIRADFFGKESIEMVSDAVSNLYSYHYDGLDRNPEIYELINLFKKFYVFNPDDLKKTNYNLFPCTNFYFDYDKDELDLNIKPEIDFYFLGSYHTKRMNDILNFKEKIEATHNANFEIVFSKKDQNKIDTFSKKNINCLTSIIPFHQYIENIKKSKIIVDFKINEHNGLSFRVFESLKYKKKLITNNYTISNYDFYHSNNIFIIIDNNYDDIESFFNLPYVEIDDNIVLKYSFKNWINYVLEINPHEKLLIK